MKSVSETVAKLCEHSAVRVLPERCALKQSVGRVLASDIVAALNVPPADNSAMDGFALRLEDWAGRDTVMPVSQRITAGTAPDALVPGTAARIFTGAEIPAGADVVVMQENCEIQDAGVIIQAVGTVGTNIRPKGQDIAAGTTVLSAGHRLRPQDIGLIASLGYADVNVWQRLKVALVSTGSELVEPGQVLEAGQIYNSNHYMLDTLLTSWGFEVKDFGITEDSAEALEQVMKKASDSADVIISTGGVSVGEEDHVKAVVEKLGQLSLWRVAIKPGKPFAFGQVGNTAFLGLPGNPVSAWVTLLVLGRGFLFDCQGAVGQDIEPIEMKALFDQKSCGREVYIRVRCSDDGVERFSQQSSGALFSTVWADAFVVQSPDTDIVCGEAVKVVLFSQFM